MLNPHRIQLSAMRNLALFKEPAFYTSKQDFFIDLSFIDPGFYCWNFKDTGDDMNITPHNRMLLPVTLQIPA